MTTPKAGGSKTAGGPLGVRKAMDGLPLFSGGTVVFASRLESPLLKFSLTLDLL